MQETTPCCFFNYGSSQVGYLAEHAAQSEIALKVIPQGMYNEKTWPGVTRV